MFSPSLRAGLMYLEWQNLAEKGRRKNKYDNLINTRKRDENLKNNKCKVDSLPSPSSPPSRSLSETSRGWVIRYSLYWQLTSTAIKCGRGRGRRLQLLSRTSSNSLLDNEFTNGCCESRIHCYSNDRYQRIENVFNARSFGHRML